MNGPVFPCVRDVDYYYYYYYLYNRIMANEAIEITQKEINRANLDRLKRVENEAGQAFGTATTLFTGGKVTEDQLNQLDSMPFKATFGGEAKDVLEGYREKAGQYFNRDDIEDLRSGGHEGNLAAMNDPSLWTAYAREHNLVIKPEA